MNIHQNYALRFGDEQNRTLRWWAALTRPAISGAILFTDIATIVGMSWLTGIAYHLVVYGHTGDFLDYTEVGLFTACIFVIPNLFRGEYALPSYFTFRPHVRRSVQLWNVTFICLLALGFLAQISAVYSRGWFVLFYVCTIAVLLALRYLFVRAIVLGSKAGLVSAQRIFLVGSGRQIDDFIGRYEPWKVGVNIVGCHFLAPGEPGTSAAERRQAVEKVLDEAKHSARSIEPDAIYLLMPWSDTDAINRYAETFLALPAEIHLGPERILDRFENVQFSKLGPMA